VSEVKVNFLNWRPDAEDVGLDGLTTADNVIHSTEGYRPVHLASAGSFATTGGLGASVATITSLVAKPVGSQNDYFCAWITDVTNPALHVGLNGVTASTSATGYPLVFTTTASNIEIYAFDVCEYGGKIVWTVEARGEDAGATVLSNAFAGYMTF